jgi:hypothetical protein
MPVQVGLNCWKIGVWPSLSDVVISWLRVQTPIHCIPYPCHMYSNVLALKYSVDGHMGAPLYCEDEGNGRILTKGCDFFIRCTDKQIHERTVRNIFFRMVSFVRWHVFLCVCCAPRKQMRRCAGRGMGFLKDSRKGLTTTYLS